MSTLIHKLSCYQAFRFIIVAPVGVAVYYLFHKQAITETGLFPSDLIINLPLIDQFVYEGYVIPHPGFHLIIFFISKIAHATYSTVAPIVMSGFVVVTIFLTNTLLAKRIPSANRTAWLLIISVCLNIVIAIYLPFFNPNPYVGQESPNIWHNPQMLFLKPFALLFFFYYMEFIQNDGQLTKRGYFILSSLLMISVVIKPSFVFAFLPATGIYLLAFHTRELHLYRKTLLLSLPTLAVLCYQYYITYYLSAGMSHYHDKIIFTYFGVMKLYTPSVVVSTLLVLAFPLSVAIYYRRELAHNIYARMAWILTAVSFAQAAFLAEQEKFSQGAFGFGYIISLFILYIFSMQVYLSSRTKDSLISDLKQLVITIIFAAHTVSGVYYLAKLLRGASYY
jgi:hypothetical protein